MILDGETFEVKGKWEIDRGPQYLAYDFWWHLGYDTMITSEWGTPQMVENGVVPELLMGGKYGHALHVWDLHKRRHLRRLDLGPEQQMALELRPAHDPTRAYGFVGVVTSLKDLSASIWLWHREGNNGADSWKVRKIIEIPAEAADPELLPPAIQGFKAVPPLVTDIVLSLDDRFLYVSCWGTGELRQYDVSDPFKPELTGSVHIGGIVRRAAHPARPDRPLNGGPQMVEVSRDGRRVYLTNSLYASWDEQFYPDGIRGWMVKLNGGSENAFQLDQSFLLEFDGMRPHQVRLEGGDASSDSYCYGAGRGGRSHGRIFAGHRGRRLAGFFQTRRRGAETCLAEPGPDLGVRPRADRGAHFPALKTPRYRNRFRCRGRIRCPRRCRTATGPSRAAGEGGRCLPEGWGDPLTGNYS